MTAAADHVIDAAPSIAANWTGGIRRIPASGATIRLKPGTNFAAATVMGRTPAETAFSPPHARVRVQRQAAEQSQHSPALDSAEGIPDQIPNPEATGARNDERHRRRVMLGGDAAREQQQRERRNRRAETFDERRGGNNSQAASQQKVKHPSLSFEIAPLR
jgi:hypothetical protein